MLIIINGETQSYDAPLTITSLLEQSGLANKRIAVELNESIVPKSQHEDTLIVEGDNIEIIHAIGGG